MRLELRPPLVPHGGGGEGGSGEVRRDIGAAVVRGNPSGGVVLELGPADGAPQLRLHLTVAEASRLSAVLHTVATNGGEGVLLVDS